MFKEAIAEFEKQRALDGSSPFGLGNLGHAYAVSGRRNDALQVLNELQELVKQGYALQSDLALVYEGLSDKDKAFECLEKAYEERESGWVELKEDPIWKSLRSDPRFVSLLKKIGLEKP